MGLQNLLTRLEEQGREEAAGILAAAQTEASRLDAEGNERLNRGREDLSRAREVRIAAAVNGGLALARREARRELLAARHGLIERVAALARTLLPEALRSDKLPLKTWAADAFASVAGRSARVTCSPAIAAALNDLLPGQSSITIVPDPAIGTGFILKTDDDALRIDCTLESRLRALLPQVGILVLHSVDGKR